MATSNKVTFGLSNVHIGEYKVDSSGSATLGTPMALPGAVSLSLDPETLEIEFYADNVKYYAQNGDNGFTGSLEVAMFTKEIKLALMGYAETADGGIVNVKGATKPAVYIAFEAKGDAQNSRGLLLNVSMGPIKHEHKTNEDKAEVETDSVDITVTGDNATGMTLVEYPPEAAGYTALFTAPKMPTLKVQPTSGTSDKAVTK